MPSERDELLNRVYARATGLWWRRRFAPIAAGVVVLSLAVGVPLLRASGGGHHTTRLATAPNETTSSAPSGFTTGDAGSTTTTTTAHDSSRPTTTAAAPIAGSHPTTTPTTRPIGVTTTPPPDPCRNNNGNSACGDFHWAHDPGANAPLQFDITPSSSSPHAGQAVTFTVHVTDPDATPINDCGADYGGGGGGCAHTMECAANYGTWDVPARQRGEATFTYQHTFSAPGTYTVHFYAESMQGGKTRSSCAAQPNPYASDGYGTATVTVS